MTDDSNEVPDDEPAPGLWWGAKQYLGMREEDKPKGAQQRNRETELEVMEHVAALVAAAPLLPEEDLRQVETILVRALQAARSRHARRAAPPGSS